jgi:exopolyphosphatase/guanosine-5'-triphosphate,3'-diphosphate pyrophosphatase
LSGESRGVGVLDVGSFSAHLVVVDPARRSLLRPVLSHKTRLRVDRTLDGTNHITDEGIVRIAEAVHEADQVARRAKIPHVVPFATSVIRDAANADEVIEQVARRTGVELRTLTGQQEAQLAYAAARHWYGYAAGSIIVLDVGGGTVEVAAGEGAQPSLARSMPFGARTLTRTWVNEHTSSRRRLRRLRTRTAERIVAELEPNELAAEDERLAVGCSKVFRQLARLAGARPHRPGTLVPSQLRLSSLDRWIPELAALPVAKRAALPGISYHRAHQCLAGAVVAEALMKATGHDVVDVCPWSTKEGLLLTLLEQQDELPADLVQAA